MRVHFELLMDLLQKGINNEVIMSVSMYIVNSKVTKPYDIKHAAKVTAMILSKFLEPKIYHLNTELFACYVIFLFLFVCMCKKHKVTIIQLMLFHMIYHTYSENEYK